VAVVPDIKTESGTTTYRKNRMHKKSGNANNNATHNTVKEPKFEGRIDALSGHIYDCSFKQADTYTKTTREIAEYVGRTFKFGNDARLAVEFLAPPLFTPPSDPAAGATKSEQRIWEKTIDEYVKRETMFIENNPSPAPEHKGRGF
jgi:hypothetical protein